MRPMCMAVLVLVGVVVVVIVVIIVSLVVVVVIIVVVTMIVMVFVVAMNVLLEQRALAELQELRFLGLQQGQHAGVPGEIVHGIVQPGCKLPPHPDDDIRVLQGRRLGGTQAVLVGRSSGRQDQVRRTDTLHDARHERMHRSDIHGHVGHLGHRGAGGKGGSKGK